MKILHIIAGLDIGGAEMMLYRLCKKQRSFGDKPFVVSLKSGGELKPLLEIDGIPVTELGFPKGKFSLSSFIKLIKLTKKEEPDIVHCWMYHANVIGSLASLFIKNLPVIWAIHNTTLSINSSSLLTIFIMRLGGLLSFLPQRIVYCSNNARTLHERYLYSKKRGVFIPNGVDVHMFSPGKKNESDFSCRFGVDSDQIIIGTIGRFDPQKDFQNFVLAANCLLLERNDIHFVMCGPGLEKSNRDLFKWIQKTKNPTSFHLLGPQLDIVKIYNSFDIFVSSSAYGEAFQIVLTEAMACGVPCVSTDIGDAAYIIGDTGYVVPAKNPQAIAEAIKELLALSEEERRGLKHAARIRIIENFSITRITQMYIELYKNI